MDRIILPKLGGHLSERQRRNKPNEIHSAPFPKAETLEEILAIAEEVARQGYRVVTREQRPLRLRAPKPGEKAVIVGQTTDQADEEDPTVFFFNGANLATGTPVSRFWFVGPDYPFLGSFEALKEYWRQHRADLLMKALVATDIRAGQSRRR